MTTLPTVQVVAERVARVASAVVLEDELGSHFCYGDNDNGHRHFVEPKDASKLVETANDVS